MKLTVWGARGSIPVSGAEFDRYGGDTTCVCLETNAGDTVILDAGTGLRPLGNLLLREDRKTFHFVLSHAHWDHLLGFPFFKPLYRDGVTIHIADKGLVLEGLDQGLFEGSDVRLGAHHADPSAGGVKTRPISSRSIMKRP